MLHRFVTIAARRRKARAGQRLVEKVLFGFWVGKILYIVYILESLQPTFSPLFETSNLGLLELNLERPCRLLAHMYNFKSLGARAKSIHRVNSALGGPANFSRGSATYVI